LEKINILKITLFLLFLIKGIVLGQELWKTHNQLPNPKSGFTYHNLRF